MDKKQIREKFLALNSRADVAALLEVKDRSLRYFLFKVRPENMYYTFKIPKKNGTTRIISAPNTKLKNIQKKLAVILNCVYEPKICAYGFVTGKNIVGNAQKHANKHMVFNVDLQDFFSQIHFGRVRGMLMKPPYSIGEEAANTIAQIACLCGKLPQGAPSSPVITNMICVPLDNALMRLAKRANCVYTRYADDITFSTNKKEMDGSIAYIDATGVHIGTKLQAVLDAHSFHVNPEKISLRNYMHRQEVTGLTVNEFPNLRRGYIKELRAILHSCKNYGVVKAAKTYIEKGLCKNTAIKDMMSKPDGEEKLESWFRSVLIGKVKYIRQIKGARNFTYLSFAQKVNAVFDEPIFDISELSHFEKVVKNSTFILECDDGKHIVQGSGFWINGVGLITSYHVTQNEGFFTVFNVDDYGDKSLGRIGKTLNEIAADEQIDYALYKMPFSIDDALTFELGDSSKLKIGDRVTIIGYPNHQKGNSPYIQSCSITSEKKFFDAPFFTVSGRVVHGASGGLVLNEGHKIIGILKGGVVDSSDELENENQGFVPIHLALEHIHSVQVAAR